MSAKVSISVEPRIALSDVPLVINVSGLEAEQRDRHLLKRRHRRKRMDGASSLPRR